MPKATAEIITKVKAANPGTDVHLVEHPNLPHDFIVKGPGRQVWNLYRQQVSNETTKVHADELVFESCVLWPEKGADRDALLEKYPAMLNVVSGEIIEIGGAAKGAVHRKL